MKVEDLEYASLSELKKFIEEKEFSSAEEWDKFAVNLYSRGHGFIVGTPEYWKMIDKATQTLLKKAPKERKGAGVHVIGKRKGFMGEDVVYVDGEITHTLHMICPITHKGCVIYRNGRKFSIAANQYL